MITRSDIRQFFETYRILEKADDFIYLLPHPRLRQWISNYTITFPENNLLSDNYTIVPHGSATLVFSCGRNKIHGNLFGSATIPCTVGEQANLFHMLFIIEFQPAGFYAFTGANQKELADNTIPFDLINFNLCDSIIKTLINAQSLYELIGNLDRLLLSDLHTACPAELELSVRSIIENMGNISVKELSDSVFYSERHLNRIFDQYMGMSAKTFSRLVRLNKAVRLLHNPKCSITNACNLTGFYDLPHFIHDFKSVCGLTPQEYRSRMSDFYSEIAKF